MKELVAQVNRNVRRRVQPPIEIKTVETLSEYIEALLDFLDTELSKLITSAKAAGSPDEHLVSGGEAALSALAVHAEFARHYFSRTVKQARLTRPSNEFDGELQAMETRSNDLKTTVSDFCSRLERLLANATGGVV
jgi:hypothetical protein